MTSHNSLPLRAGDLVTVRSKEEVLASLDADGALDALPFMPEMLKYCGQEFRVYRRADKTCDTIDNSGGRRMHDTVHLEGLRCDGSAHGGCEAGCLFFWKEDWLQRADGRERAHGSAAPDVSQRGATESDLQRACMVCSSARPGSQVIYRCQATRLKEASEPLAWWDVRQYLRDLWTGNAGVWQMVRGFALAGYRILMNIGRGHRVKVALFNAWQSLWGGVPYPWKVGSADKTPTGELNLQPGEWVRVKLYDYILTTLNKNNRNRGMWFDPQMVRCCGRIYRVHKRVRRIIDEKYGHMIEFKNPAVILENIYCRGEMTEKRLFCPRSIYIYWRELWLERIDPPQSSEPR
ncbi:MAG: hypothetical protein L0Z68_05280 [Gammaproteobacteria bacterium]|nr:hypothetical protein [Gammaproteobacteria bacterium]